jgi:hypothetical protein
MLLNTTGATLQQPGTELWLFSLATRCKYQLFNNSCSSSLSLSDVICSFPCNEKRLSQHPVSTPTIALSYSSAVKYQCCHLHRWQTELQIAQYFGCLSKFKLRSFYVGQAAMWHGVTVRKTTVSDILSFSLSLSLALVVPGILSRQCRLPANCPAGASGGLGLTLRHWATGSRRRKG